MYAPLALQQAAADAAERVLYVFGCVAPGCGCLPGSWRAFRCQLLPAAPDTGAAAEPAAAPPGPWPPAPAAPNRGGSASWSTVEPLRGPGEPSSIGADSAQLSSAAGSVCEEAWGSNGDWSAPEGPPAAAAPAAEPTAARSDSPQPALAECGAPADAWGGGGDWGAGSPGGASDAFNLSDIDAALAALAHKAKSEPPHAQHPSRQSAKSQAGPNACARTASSNPAGPSEPSARRPAAVPSCVGPASQPRLPGFYLHAAAEPGALGPAALPPQEAAHIAALLAEYEHGSATTAVRCCPARSKNCRENQGLDCSEAQGLCCCVGTMRCYQTSSCVSSHVALLGKVYSTVPRVSEGHHPCCVREEKRMRQKPFNI